MKDRLALAADVRGALALVERGEAAAGIVYATDAAITRRVAVAGLFSADAHAPILYPLAIMAERRSPAAEDFHAFLRSEAARETFRAHGFGLPPGAGLAGAEG